MEFSVADARTVLSRTPLILRAMLEGLPESWLHASPEPGGWSAFNVVGHLIDGEETDWIPRTRIILERSGRAFEPFDRFAHLSRDQDATLPTLLDRFAELRARNLAQLGATGLTPDHLALPGLHPALGPVTLKQLLATWVVHYLGHLAQANRALASAYRDQVGPWREYLPVLATPTGKG